MRFEFILDQPQYDDCLLPIAEVAESLGIEVTFSRFNSRDFAADAHFLVQDFAALCCPSPRIFVPHGLSLMKMFHFALEADAVLVPSEALHKALGHQLLPRAKAYAGIGHPKTDRLLQYAARTDHHRRAVREAHAMDDRPLVVHMPSWKNDAVRIHHQRFHRLDEVEEVLGRRFNVLTLPHDLDQEREQIRALTPLQAHIERLAYLVAADVVLTDNSGVGFECAAIDKPMVLLGHPHIPGFFDDVVINPGRQIDYGPVATLETLPETVESVLADPQGYRQKRAHWASMVLGPVDGGSARRLARKVLNDVIGRLELTASGASQGPCWHLGDFVREFRFFRSEHEVRQGADVRIDIDPDKSRTIFFGPYISLPPGTYLLDLDFASSEPSRIFDLQVTFNHARDSIPLARFAGKAAGRFVFSIPETQILDKSVEFTLTGSGDLGGSLTLTRFDLHALRPRHAGKVRQPTP